MQSGALSPLSLPSILAPISHKGFVTLFIGLWFKYLSPFKIKKPFLLANNPIKILIAVPEFLQSRI